MPAMRSVGRPAGRVLERIDDAEEQVSDADLFRVGGGSCGIVSAKVRLVFCSRSSTPVIQTPRIGTTLAA